MDIEDHGELGPTCEMCESQGIGYIHYMQHRDVPGLLACGCVCAGHMEGDLATARECDALMISRAGKRKRWFDRKWNVSKQGNDYIKADGYTSDAAKLAAFDLITRLQSSRTQAE